MLNRYVELYKCAMLTIIALILFGIYLRTPIPFTIGNFRNKVVDAQSMPLVRISGSVNVND